MRHKIMLRGQIWDSDMKFKFKNEIFLPQEMAHLFYTPGCHIDRKYSLLFVLKQKDLETNI